MYLVLAHVLYVMTNFSGRQILPSPPPVPAAPRNFTLQSVPGQPTQLSAAWSPPVPANGIILSYTLYCSASAEQVYPEQEILHNFELSYSSDIQSAILSNLNIFTNYCCFLLANTSAGMGDDVFLCQRTDEDGQYLQYLHTHIYTFLINILHVRNMFIHTNLLWPIKTYRT